MTNYVIAYVAAFFVPLLFHSWRVAVMGLAIQGLILALILTSGHHLSWSWLLAFEVGNLVLIRAILIPWYLFRKMRGQELANDFSFISKSLFQWMLAVMLLVVAFIFGNKMSPQDSREAIHVGAAAGSVLIGMLILANQRHPFGQLIGLCAFEGGVTLMELLSPHAMPLPVSVGVSLVFVTFVLTCGIYLRKFQRMAANSADVESLVVL